MSTTIYHSLEIDGLKVFYREAGRKGAPALLLLHGFLSAPELSAAFPQADAAGRDGRMQPPVKE